MPNDVELRTGIRAMLASIDVPPVPPDSIVYRPLPSRASSRIPRFVPAAIAACLALVIVFAPKTSWSFVQSVASRVAAILHWSPPPEAPRAFVRQMHAHEVPLDQARTMVDFHLVAPSWVPSDATLSSVIVIPTAHYAPETKTWSIAPNAVLFNYKRRGGGSFHLMASASGPERTLSKYMFEEVGTKSDGMPILKRHEQFYWRNGDQTISTMDEGITAPEILAIRDAMHGVSIETQWPLKQRKGTTMYYLPKP